MVAGRCTVIAAALDMNAHLSGLDRSRRMPAVIEADLQLRETFDLAALCANEVRVLMHVIATTILVAPEAIAEVDAHDELGFDEVTKVAKHGSAVDTPSAEGFGDLAMRHRCCTLAKELQHRETRLRYTQAGVAQHRVVIRFSRFSGHAIVYVIATHMGRLAKSAARAHLEHLPRRSAPTGPPPTALEAAKTDMVGSTSRGG